MAVKEQRLALEKIAPVGGQEPKDDMTCKPFEFRLTEGKGKRRDATPLAQRVSAFMPVIEQKIVEQLSERYLKSNKTKNELRLVLRDLGFDL